MIKNINIRGLSAKVYVPKKINKTIILSHGFLLDKNGPEELFKELSEKLYRLNYFVIRYNFRLNKNNKQETSKYVLNDYLEDITTIIKYSKKYNNEIILVGHSLGGLISLIEANRNKNIEKLILLSPPIKIKLPKIKTLKKFSKNPNIIILFIKFLLSGFKINLTNYYKKINIKTLFIYGTNDQFENYEKVKNINNKNIKFLKIEMMDHFYKGYKKEIIDEIIKFV